MTSTFIRVRSAASVFPFAINSAGTKRPQTSQVRPHGADRDALRIPIHFAKADNSGRQENLVNDEDDAVGLFHVGNCDVCRTAFVIGD